MKIHLLLALMGSVAISTACVHTRALSPAQDKCREASTQATSENSKGEFTDARKMVELLSGCIAGPEIPAKAKAVAYQLRSRAYGQLGEHPQAIADQETAYRLNPSANTGWDIITRAETYRNAGQAAHALTLLQDMFDQRIGLFGKGTTPGMPSYYHLGRTLVELQQWPEAAEAFTEGLTYQPDYPWAYLYRAVAYDALDYQQWATADVCKAMKLIDATSASAKEQSKRSLEEPPFRKLLTQRQCP